MIPLKETHQEPQFTQRAAPSEQERNGLIGENEAAVSLAQSDDFNRSDELYRLPPAKMTSNQNYGNAGEKGEESSGASHFRETKRSPAHNERLRENRRPPKGNKERLEKH